MGIFEARLATRRAVKRRALVLGSTAVGLTLMLGTSSAAYAQDNQAAQGQSAQDQTTPSKANTNKARKKKERAAEEGIEQVTVYGFRKSIQLSLDVKRNSEDVVEALTAEDIGKLPDESIADSLARLPGLAAQRDNNGRWQDISVNGLPPSMSVTLFNGRPQASTDNNRVIQFDQYPAELMSGVKVYKTGDATLVNSAISTVDLQTVRPLDYGHRALQVGAMGEYDTRGDLQPGAQSLGGRFNVSYIDQFAGGKLGVMIGYALMAAPNQIYAQHPYSFNEPNDVVTGLQDQVRSDVLTRNGLISTVQYKPSEHFQVVLDGFYSTYDDNAIIRGVEVQTACCGNATPVGTPTQGVSSWIVTPQLLNYDYDNKSKQYSLGGTMTYKFGNNWTLTGDLGFSEANRNDSRIELYSGFGTNGMQNTSTATLTAGAGAEGMIGISGWSLPLYNNPAIAIGENLRWQQGWWPGSWPQGGNGPTFGTSYGSAYFQRILSDDIIRDTTWSLRRDLTGFIASVEVGVGYTDRSKNYVDHEGIGALTGMNEAAAIPSGWLLGPTNLSAFGLPNMFSINPNEAWASGFYTYLERPDEVGYDWSVREKVITPYIASQIDTTLFGRSLSGNVGVQFVHTDQYVADVAKGGNWPNYTFVPYAVDTTYWDVLPSMNLTWKMNDTQQLRLGVGRSIARARFDSMGGGLNINYNAANANSTSLASSPWSGSLGNPRLKPWVSDDVDVTYEDYFSPGEALFVEAFYKNLESFIYDSTTVADFHPFASLGVPPPKLWQGPVSEYVNGNGGSLEGLVIGGNVLLNHISPLLDGFGIQAQGTVINSSVIIPDANTSPTHQIPELSKYSFNVSFYWERNGYSFRINDRYRSSYVQEVPNFDGTLQAIQGASENTVDLQLGYLWNNFNFTFSAENLTDTPMNSFIAGNPNHPEYFKLFGTNLLLGVSYKY